MVVDVVRRLVGGSGGILGDLNLSLRYDVVLLNTKDVSSSLISTTSVLQLTDM